MPNTSTPSVSNQWVNVYYHIVRTNQQTGGLPVAELCKATSDANKIFNKYGIFINNAGYDFIDNSNLYTFVANSTNSNALFGHPQAKPNVLNIYIVDAVVDPIDPLKTFGGCARNIPSIALCIDKSSISNSTSTLAHELGHCFGLYHTHKGTPLFPEHEVKDPNDPNDPTCRELDNSNNGTTCGDFINDTPADPGLTARVSNCSYQSSDLQNGFPYSPDVRNVMSYAPTSCRDRFSPLQINAMLNTITNNSTVSTIRTSLPIPSISGTNTVCIYNLFIASNTRAGFTPTWSSSNEDAAYIFSPSSNPSLAYIYKINGGNSTITAKFSDGCNAYYISKNIFAGTPLMQGTYTYGTNTYPVNPTSTGIGVSGSTPTIYINLTKSDADTKFT